MASKKQKIGEHDFAALDKFAHGITLEKLRPLSPSMRKRWEAAKKLGRPRKPAGTKAVPTLITVEPQLLKKIDAEAKKAGVSRSQFFAEAAKRHMRRAG